MDPIDKTLCSFFIPEFDSDEDEQQWVWSLSPQQRLELLELSRLARYGAAALARPIDRSRIEMLTMQEVAKSAEVEDEQEERWRLEHAWPPRIPELRRMLLDKAKSGGEG